MISWIYSSTTKAAHPSTTRSIPSFDPYTVPGKGCYVAPRNVELLREENLKKIEEHIDEALRLALEAGLAKEELLEMVTFALEEQL